jgi:hypothetical protein
MNRANDLIRNLLEDIRWEAIDKVMEELKMKWQDENCKGENEFETIWNLAFKEGKLAGLEDFKNILEQKAND